MSRPANGPTMNRWLVPAILAVALLALGGAPVAFAQPVDDLRKDVEALKQDQAAIRKELAEIKELLRARGAPPQAGAGANDVRVAVQGAPVLGQDGARVTIVEFSDYQCPFCARYSRETYPQLDRDYIRTGKVRYVFRDLPIESLHPQAFKAHEAANCAGDQNKYWEMHDRLFANQAALAAPALSAHAQAMGLDSRKFQACLDTGRHAGEIRQDLAASQAASINSTPSFFIGVLESAGTVRSSLKITGAKPYAVFKAAIDAVLTQP